MSTGAVLDHDAGLSVLSWAAQRCVPLVVSLLRTTASRGSNPANPSDASRAFCCNLRSQFVGFDAGPALLQIRYPVSTQKTGPVEIAAGDRLGLSFRRGHKKCVLIGEVMARRTDRDRDGQVADMLLVRPSGELRELQRRVYQRVTVPRDRFIAVKLWEGCAPETGGPSWPLCAGRLANVSVGGILVEIRADQNPRLGVGDPVGVEITVIQGRPPLLAEAQYRHCCLEEADRLGLGLQFVGLEHEVPGRATLAEVAEFVKWLQREGGPGGRCCRR